MTDARHPNLYSVYRGDQASEKGAWTRRALDIVLAIIALIIFAPFMLLISLCIWLENGRPIIFSQTRFGYGGQYFRMYKFRKFHRDCGTNGCPLTMTNDRRMTRLGSFLQATKLDELPQLWNILAGEMSFVGPRPETTEFGDCFTREYWGLFDHKPGIFGPSQVVFRNESSLYTNQGDPQQFYRDVLFPAKARIDLAYYSRRSVLSDFAWIVRGALAVFGLFCPSSPFLPGAPANRTSGEETSL